MSIRCAKREAPPIDSARYLREAVRAARTGAVLVALAARRRRCCADS